ncbi:hypothetical protein VIGAN_11002600, partial [Vigna angularis var. angularis]
SLNAENHPFQVWNAKRPNVNPLFTPFHVLSPLLACIHLELLVRECLFSENVAGIVVSILKSSCPHLHYFFQLGFTWVSEFFFTRIKACV